MLGINFSNTINSKDFYIIGGVCKRLGEFNIQSSKNTNYVLLSPIMLAVSFSISILVFTPSLLQKNYGHAFVINSNPSPSQLLKTPPFQYTVLYH